MSVPFAEATLQNRLARIQVIADIGTLSLQGASVTQRRTAEGDTLEDLLLERAQMCIQVRLLDTLHRTQEERDKAHFVAGCLFLVGLLAFAALIGWSKLDVQNNSFGRQ